MKKNRKNARRCAMEAIVDAETEAERRAFELGRCTDRDEEIRVREDALRIRTSPMGAGERREPAVRQMHRLVPGNRGKLA